LASRRYNELLSREELMGKINWSRVFLGGLAGGVIVLAVDIFVNGVLFGNEWKAAYEKLGHPPAASGLIILVIWALLVGICATWLYAAARPRFGPGPKTAVKTGFAFWIFGYGLPTIGLLSFYIFPPHLPIVSAAGGIAGAILASLMGGWVYRE
jgi:hypothetical protein